MPQGLKFYAVRPEILSLWLLKRSLCFSEKIVMFFKTITMFFYRATSNVSIELVTFSHLLNSPYNLPNRFLNKSASASKPIHLLSACWRTAGERSTITGTSKTPNNFIPTALADFVNHQVKYFCVTVSGETRYERHIELKKYNNAPDPATSSSSCHY